MVSGNRFNGQWETRGRYNNIFDLFYFGDIRERADGGKIICMNNRVQKSHSREALQFGPIP